MPALHSSIFVEIKGKDILKSKTRVIAHTWCYCRTYFVCVGVGVFLPAYSRCLIIIFFIFTLPSTLFLFIMCLFPMQFPFVC